ncbi:hypothetical protein KP509_01G092300 [Ceratopteris richardii]|uniref:Tify domain-containing protein n=1 Tax=Ceratopteris richardii TaxID=49495 RepID=A0A8T2VIG8_CERRI|nr:hypothetical protein KP509_01G092300 [Ceratopteris richardii]
MPSSTPLSLKARETASLSLKFLFEELLQAARSSSLDLIPTMNMNNQIDESQHSRKKIQTNAATSAEPDLDLRLGLSSPPSKPSNTVADSCILRKTTSETASKGSGQLTIFYAGSMHVYNFVTADEAKAIMILAETKEENISTDAHQSILARSSRSSSPQKSSFCLKAAPTKDFKRSHERVPFARKASLARFLKKRKEWSIISARESP